MSIRNKKPQFKKSINWDEHDEPITPEHKRQVNDYSNENTISEQRKRAKLELINKYNMSESEAEETLRDIEKKAMPQKTKEDTYESNTNKTEEIIPEHAQKEEKQSQETKPEHKEKEEKPHKNVDELISSIIPDSEKELCIEVKNVSLSFEIATEKIDNLKELFIRTLKRNKGNVTKFQALKISISIFTKVKR